MLLFPFEKVEKDSNIILYGAGDCGKQYFRQIINSGYCNIVSWVDKNAEDFKIYPDKLGCLYPVEPIEKIREISDFDYIVISIVNQDAMESVKRMLKENYGIEEKKIISGTKYFSEDTVYGTYENEVKYGNIEPAEEKTGPETLISRDELSLMPRFLLARDIKNGIYNEANISLYKRTILAQGDIFTGRNYFSQRDKKTIDDFLKDFNKLVESMESKGFERENYIPIAYKNRVLLDGQHRIAAALVREKEIWTKYYDLKGEVKAEFTLDWFKNQGFSTEDLQRILYAYTSLKNDCGIYVFFATAVNNWEYFKSQIEKSQETVGYIDLDFSNDYIAFENIMREMYKDSLWSNVQIHLKTKLLKMAPLKFRVLITEKKEDAEESIYESVRKTKLLLREAVSEELEVLSGAVMHASDSEEEFKMLRDILLSPNALKNISRMTQRTWSNSFIERLRVLEAELLKLNINKENIVIAGGSVLEVFGLRESPDLDVIVKSSERKHIGADGRKISEEIDICSANNIVLDNGKLIEDDIIIEDENLHFKFFGFKFVNLEILKRKKIRDSRGKDLEDIRLIELFEEYYNNFDEKAALRKQIDRELHLRRF